MFLVSYTDAPGWLWPFGLVGIAATGPLVFEPSSTMQRIDLGGLRTPNGRRRLRAGLAYGLMSGLVGGLMNGLAYGLAHGLNGALLDGLMCGLGGLAYGLAGGLAGEVAAVSSASVLARQCLAYTVMVVLMGVLADGLLGVLAVVLGFRPAFGAVLAIGLAFGLALGLTMGKGSVWLRYAIAVRAAARQGSLPRRPARFLDWCLHTGLMRMAGSAIQFRHRRLQEALTPASDTTRKSASSTQST